MLGGVRSDRFGSKPLQNRSEPARTSQNRPEPEITGNNRACSRNTRAIYGPPGAIQGPNMANTQPPPKKIPKIGHIYGLYMAIYTDYILPIYRIYTKGCEKEGTINRGGNNCGPRRSLRVPIHFLYAKITSVVRSFNSNMHEH